jgi:transposase
MIEESSFSLLRATITKLDNALVVITGLQREIERLSEEVESLRKENAALKVENAQLKAENSILKEENATLKELLNKNSSNSSFPPSRDMKKPKLKRQSSGKKRGGQFGQERVKRAKFENPDRVVECPVPCECECSGKIIPQDNVVVHQVVDIPSIIPKTVVEYRRQTGRCNSCRKRVTAALPAGVPTGIFGPNLIALMSKAQQTPG